MHHGEHITHSRDTFGLRPFGFYLLISPKSSIFKANLFRQSGQIKNAVTLDPEAWYSKSTTDNVIGFGLVLLIHIKVIDLIRAIISCFAIAKCRLLNPITNRYYPKIV